MVYRNTFTVLVFLSLSIACLNLSWNLSRNGNVKNDAQYETTVIYSGHLTSRSTKNVVKTYKSYYPRSCAKSVSPSYLHEYDLTVFTVSSTCRIDENIFNTALSKSSNVAVQIPYAWNFDDAKHDLCVNPLSQGKPWTVKQSFLNAKFVYPILLSDKIVYETCDLQTVANVNFYFSFEYSRGNEAGPLSLYVSHDRGVTWNDQDTLREASDQWKTYFIQITAESDTIRWKFTTQEALSTSGEVAIRDIKMVNPPPSPPPPSPPPPSPPQPPSPPPSPPPRIQGCFEQFSDTIQAEITRGVRSVAVTSDKMAHNDGDGVKLYELAVDDVKTLWNHRLTLNVTGVTVVKLAPGGDAVLVRNATKVALFSWNAVLISSIDLHTDLGDDEVNLVYDYFADSSESVDVIGTAPDFVFTLTYCYTNYLNETTPGNFWKQCGVRTYEVSRGATSLMSNIEGFSRLIPFSEHDVARGPRVAFLGKRKIVVGSPLDRMSNGGYVRVFDAMTGNKVATYSDPANRYGLSVSGSKDSSTFVVGSDNFFEKHFNGATMRFATDFEAHALVASGTGHRVVGLGNPLGTSQGDFTVFIRVFDTYPGVDYASYELPLNLSWPQDQLKHSDVDISLAPEGDVLAVSTPAAVWTFRDIFCPSAVAPPQSPPPLPPQPPSPLLPCHSCSWSIKYGTSILSVDYVLRPDATTRPCRYENGTIFEARDNRPNSQPPVCHGVLDNGYYGEYYYLNDVNPGNMSTLNTDRCTCDMSAFRPQDCSVECVTDGDSDHVVVLRGRGLQNAYSDQVLCSNLFPTGNDQDLVGKICWQEPWKNEACVCPVHSPSPPPSPPPNPSPPPPNPPPPPRLRRRLRRLRHRRISRRSHSTSKTWNSSSTTRKKGAIQ